MFENCYFITGTAYAGKSTVVKQLAEAYGGIACEENYHDALLDELDPAEFPNLTYTRDLQDWRDFIRRTPDEAERWADAVAKECEILELRILRGLEQPQKMVFVDTNISTETLHEIAAENHVLVMLTDPEISVRRFFERPDREKQFLYRLLTEEPDPEQAMENFRLYLMRMNSPERNQRYRDAGFPVLERDDRRSIAETVQLAAQMLGLVPC